MSLADTLDQLKELDFNDLDFERIGTWPIAGRVFIWIMVFVLILVGAYFFAIKDLNTDLNRQLAQETQLRNTLKQRAQEAANLDDYRKQMIQIREVFDAQLKQLPTDSEVPGLLEELTDRGSAAGLEIKEVALLDEVVKEYYVELPISIVVVGGYHELGAFVSGVASLSRIVTLHDYSITNTRENALLEMKILAKTYRNKPSE